MRNNDEDRIHNGCKATHVTSDWRALDAMASEDFRRRRSAARHAQRSDGSSLS